MSNPFEPIERETRIGDQIELSWNGLTFTVTADPQKLPVSTLRAFEEGRAATAVGLLLGTKQMAQFEAAGALVADIETIMEQWAQAVGITLGE